MVFWTLMIVIGIGLAIAVIVEVVLNRRQERGPAAAPPDIGRNDHPSPSGHAAE